jgi:hypothetical protein
LTVGAWTGLRDLLALLVRYDVLASTDSETTQLHHTHLLRIANTAVSCITASNQLAVCRVLDLIAQLDPDVFETVSVWPILLSVSESEGLAVTLLNRYSRSGQLQDFIDGWVGAIQDSTTTLGGVYTHHFLHCFVTVLNQSMNTQQSRVILSVIEAIQKREGVEPLSVLLAWSLVCGADPDGTESLVKATKKWPILDRLLVQNAMPAQWRKFKMSLDDIPVTRVLVTRFALRRAHSDPKSVEVLRQALDEINVDRALTQQWDGKCGSLAEDNIDLAVWMTLCQDLALLMYVPLVYVYCRHLVPEGMQRATDCFIHGLTKEPSVDCVTLGMQSWYLARNIMTMELFSQGLF